MKNIFVIIFLTLFAFTIKAQSYTDIKVSHLPKAATNYISQNMPGSEITRAVKIDDNGVVKYAAVFETRGRKHAMIFDQNGNFLEKADNLKASTQKEKADQPAASTQTKTPGASSVNADLKTVPVENLPGNVVTYLNSTYPNGKILYARQLVKKDISFYQVTVSDGDKEHIVTFNSKGKYTSQRTTLKPSGNPAQVSKTEKQVSKAEKEVSKTEKQVSKTEKQDSKVEKKNSKADQVKKAPDAKQPASETKSTEKKKK